MGNEQRVAVCPDPGTPHKKPNGHRPPKQPGCFSQWQDDRRARRKPMWADLKEEAWEMFRTARGDEW